MRKHRFGEQLLQNPPPAAPALLYTKLLKYHRSSTIPKKHTKTIIARYTFAFRMSRLHYMCIFALLNIAIYLPATKCNS
jgi:hypothetical protein